MTSHVVLLLELVCRETSGKSAIWTREALECWDQNSMEESSGNSEQGGDGDVDNVAVTMRFQMGQRLH